MTPAAITRLENVLSAIVREEGRPADDTNPFDIRDPVWFPGVPGNRKYFDGTPVKYKHLGTSGTFWDPRTRSEGLAAGGHLLWLHAAEGDTLAGFLGGNKHYSGFAPSSENNTAAYIAMVARAAKVNPDNPMWEWIAE